MFSLKTFLFFTFLKKTLTILHKKLNFMSFFIFREKLFERLRGLDNLIEMIVFLDSFIVFHSKTLN